MSGPGYHIGPGFANSQARDLKFDTWSKPVRYDPHHHQPVPSFNPERTIHHFLIIVTATPTRLENVISPKCAVLTDILIRELMRQTHPLRLMLNRTSIHNSLSELFNNRLVDRIALPHGQF
jgi:hypothetical protein